MKRLVICIVILMSITAISFGSLVISKKSNAKLCTIIDTVSHTYENEGDTKSEIEKLENYWESYYKLMSYFTRRDHLNEISTSVGKLRFLLENDSDEFIAELEGIRIRAEILYRL